MIVSKLLAAETKLKLTYIIFFKSCVHIKAFKWIIYVNFNSLSASNNLPIFIKSLIPHRLKNSLSCIVFNIL